MTDDPECTNQAMEDIAEELCQAAAFVNKTLAAHLQAGIISDVSNVGLHEWVVNDIKTYQGGEEAVVC